MPGKRIRILIADDHPIFRSGLTRLIELDKELELIGEATDGSEALNMVQQKKPDILLMDLAMPGLTGIDVLQQLTKLNLNTRAVILTAAIDGRQTMQALELGARGIVLKDTASQLLIKCIKCVMDGEYWIGRNNVNGLVQAIQSAQGANETRERPFGLTHREMEVIAAIVDGSSNKDIAQRFAISEQTVKHHLSSIFDKVGVSNRLELALFSVNHQLTNKR